MSEAPLLRAEGIHAYYGESHVLQGVSLSVAAGQIVAVLGRNGVGKTTLVRALIGFTPARRGKVYLDDAEVTRWPSHRIARAGVGIVPQGRRIFPSLTVRETLEIAARPGSGAVQWDMARVLAVFPALGERLAHRAGTLSGGEQQMLAVARALLGNPRCLLLDEPTEGLSPFLVESLAALIGELRHGGLAVLLVEQNVAFALAHADRVQIMEKGLIVHESDPASLLADPALIANYLGI